MPMYTYRREDGTTFDYRQKFLDEPLTVDPATGQKVVRVVHAAGIIFKGSGFYVNDSKSASRSTNTSTPKDNASTADAPKAETKSETPAAETKKTETKSEAKSTPKPAAAD